MLNPRQNVIELGAFVQYSDAVTGAVEDVTIEEPDAVTGVADQVAWNPQRAVSGGSDTWRLRCPVHGTMMRIDLYAVTGAAGTDRIVAYALRS